MRQWIGLTLLAAFGAVGTGTPGRADEEKIGLDQLPAPVAQAVTQKFPGADRKSASKETENGKTLYEVSLKYEGADFDVTLSEQGGFVEIEKTIKEADLPEAVSKAVKDKYAKAKITKAEHVTKGTEKYFEVHLKDGDKAREVMLDPSGKILKEEEGEED